MRDRRTKEMCEFPNYQRRGKKNVPINSTDSINQTFIENQQANFKVFTNDNSKERGGEGH